MAMADAAYTQFVSDNLDARAGLTVAPKLRWSLS